MDLNIERAKILALEAKLRQEIVCTRQKGDGKGLATVKN